jgi:hypothetical protein
MMPTVNESLGGTAADSFQPGLGEEEEPSQKALAAPRRNAA